MLPRDTERGPILAPFTSVVFRGEAIKGVRDRGIFLDDTQPGENFTSYADRRTPQSREENNLCFSAPHTHTAF